MQVCSRPFSTLVIAAVTTSLFTFTSCIRAPLPDTRVADELAIRKLDAQWSRDASAHDLRATVSYYADDAVLLAPDEPLATTKGAIRDSWAGAFAVFPVLSWDIRTIDGARSGDLAYLTGAWSGTMKDANGATTPVAGKLLEVWKKQPTGAWKCVADTYNSDAPLASTPSAKK